MKKNLRRCQKCGLPGGTVRLKVASDNRYKDYWAVRRHLCAKCTRIMGTDYCASYLLINEIARAYPGEGSHEDRS